MSLPLSDIIVPTFLGGLTTLESLLHKASAHADSTKIDPRALLDARLFPDMFSFTRQIQVATDLARRGFDRIIGSEPTSVEDNETTFAELIARVQSTIAHVRAVDRAAVDAAESREFSVDVGQKLDFTGRTYVLTFAIPNFLFHVTTAYDILRHNGLAIGKRDYLAPFMMVQSPRTS